MRLLIPVSRRHWFRNRVKGYLLNPLRRRINTGFQKIQLFQARSAKEASESFINIRRKWPVVVTVFDRLIEFPAGSKQRIADGFSCLSKGTDAGKEWRENVRCGRVQARVRCGAARIVPCPLLCAGSTGGGCWCSL